MEGLFLFLLALCSHMISSLLFAVVLIIWIAITVNKRQQAWTQLMSLPSSSIEGPISGTRALEKATETAKLLSMRQEEAKTRPKEKIQFKNKLNRVKHLYPSGFLIPNPSLCSPKYLGEHVETLVLVATKPEHLAYRQAIRQTWAKAPQMLKTHEHTRHAIRVGFMVGKSKTPRRNKKLLVENGKYGDIVQGRFLDTYENLTLKSIAMLEYMTRHCPGASFLLKTDDDVFINQIILAEFIRMVENVTNAIFGQEIDENIPIRQKHSKWYVPKWVYPWEVYPRFCGGPAYLIPRAAAEAILYMAPEELFFPFEDVFVTGFVASRIGIPCIGVGEFYNQDPFTNSDPSQPLPCFMTNVISFHGLDPPEKFFTLTKLLRAAPNSCFSDRPHRLVL